MRRPRDTHRALGARRVGDVAGDGATADLGGDRRGGRLVDVEERDPGAGFGERPRGRRAEAGTAAGDDGGMSLDLHPSLPDPPSGAT
jgi:hypothetical protein